MRKESTIHLTARLRGGGNEGAEALVVMLVLAPDEQSVSALSHVRGTDWRVLRDFVANTAKGVEGAGAPLSWVSPARARLTKLLASLQQKYTKEALEAAQANRATTRTFVANKTFEVVSAVVSKSLSAEQAKPNTRTRAHAAAAVDTVAKTVDEVARRWTWEPGKCSPRGYCCICGETDMGIAQQLEENGSAIDWVSCLPMGPSYTAIGSRNLRHEQDLVRRACLIRRAVLMFAKDANPTRQVKHRPRGGSQQLVEHANEQFVLLGSVGGASLASTFKELMVLAVRMEAAEHGYHRRCYLRMMDRSKLLLEEHVRLQLKVRFFTIRKC